ncbi:MAG TPA: hypothetical protein VKM55_25065 [Candidatus Lokiarchaeia archaeon]|nr:hypothetical protein [Candidatus Lokiarchaeia archaeon]
MDFYDVMLFFGNHSAWLLLPAVAIIYTWVFEAKKRPDVNKKEWERGVNVSTLVKVFSYIGMVYGFFLMVGAVMMELNNSAPSTAYDVLHGNAVNHFTAIVYFLTGAIMFFKPLKDVPLAALISLGLAIGVTIICMTVIPNSKLGSAVEYLIPLKWLLLIIFLVVLALTYSLTKLSIGFLTTLSKVVSKAPFAFIFASFVLVQAIMLIAGYSIVAW